MCLQQYMKVISKRETLFKSNIKITFFIYELIHTEEKKYGIAIL